MGELGSADDALRGGDPNARRCPRREGLNCARGTNHGALITKLRILKPFNYDQGESMIPFRRGTHLLRLAGTSINGTHRKDIKMPKWDALMPNAQGTVNDSRSIIGSLQFQ